MNTESVPTITYPRITKATALAKLEQEWRRVGIHRTRGLASAIATMLGATRQAVSQWGDDEDIPELMAWRLKALRPQWFDQAPL